MNGPRSLDLKSGGRGGRGGGGAGQLLDGVREGREGGMAWPAGGRCNGSVHGSLHVSSSELRLIAAATIASNIHTHKSACMQCLASCLML